MTEAEFAEIVNSTKKIVLSAINKHLFAEFYGAIDDVVQETYIRAYRGLKKNAFKGDSSLSSWLYSIARNESIRMTSKLLREKEKEQKLRKEKENFEKNPGRDGEKNFINLMEIRNCINNLPLKYKEVFTLLVEGFSEKEIAARLDISTGTVKSRKSRGKEMLLKMANKI